MILTSEIQTRNLVKQLNDTIKNKNVEINDVLPTHILVKFECNNEMLNCLIVCGQLNTLVYITTKTNKCVARKSLSYENALLFLQKATDNSKLTISQLLKEF